MNLPTDRGPYGLLNHKQCPDRYLILTLQLFSNLWTSLCTSTETWAAFMHIIYVCVYPHTLRFIFRYLHMHTFLNFTCLKFQPSLVYALMEQIDISVFWRSKASLKGKKKQKEALLLLLWACKKLLLPYLWRFLYMLYINIYINLQCTHVVWLNLLTEYLKKWNCSSI